MNPARLFGSIPAIILLTCIFAIAFVGCETTDTSDAQNAGITADAGPDFNTAVRAEVVLDGSGSESSNGDITRYTWYFILRPAGSESELTYNPAYPTARFTPDSLGLYGIRLTVEDEYDFTDTDTIYVTGMEMGVPYAVAGDDIWTDVDVQGTLDGSDSWDPDTQPLTYSWHALDPQQLTITNEDEEQADFVLVWPGRRQAVLTVSDGTYESTDTVMILSNPPEITGIDPLGGTAGTVLTINGKNFHPVMEWNRVTVGDVVATKLSASPTQITVEVPEGPYSDETMTVKVEVTTVVHTNNIAVGPPFVVAQWIPQANPATTYLHDISFYDDSFGIAVGVEGTFITHTSGDTWEWWDPGTTAELRGVCAIDLNTAWAVGNDGTIIKTIDGGYTWTPQTSNTWQDLWGVHFIDADHGMAVGHDATVCVTSDGGATWTATWRVNDLRMLIADVQMISTSVAWAIGNGTIFYTDDGGATWSTEPTINIYVNLGLSFTDANTGTMVGGAGSIIRTTDGGASWTDVSVATPNQLYDVHFYDYNNGMTVGTNGLIYRTINGGADWFLEEVEVPSLHGVFMTSEIKAYAVGGEGTIIVRLP